MIVAAHQPHYLPWIGYLAKIARADLFVVMDDLQFEARNFQNRQRLKLAQGAAWLTVPLGRGGQTERLLDKRIAPATHPTHHWQHRHWATLLTHYRRAPHFARYAEPLRAVYTRPWTTLVELDLHMLALALEWLDIRTPILRSSQLGLVGRRTARLVDLCTKLGARAYLAGVGGSTTYLDVAQLRDAGIDLRWQQFTHPVYPQRYPECGFASHLGFLDLLFNCGPGSREILLAASRPARSTPWEAARAGGAP